MEAELNPAASGAADAHESASDVWSGHSIRRRYPERLPLRAKNRSILFVDVDRIDWIQADGDHVLIHCGPTTHRVRLTVAAMEAMLDPARFARIHRSTIISLARLREMRPWPTGEYIVIMRDGRELTMSRGYRAHVLKQITRGVV